MTATLTQQIEALIASRGLGPGQRLPSERALAVELGISRSRLREAMQQLVSRGVVVSRQGGGTYVAIPDAGGSLERAMQPLGFLVRAEPGFWRDVMELRKSLETDAAYYAAQRAGANDRARLRAALDAVTQDDGADATSQAAADAAFHMAIAEASHNAVLRQVMAGLFALMRMSIAESLKQIFHLPHVAGQLVEQHRAIADAILAGEPDTARSAAAAHLAFVEDCLQRMENETARERRAALARNSMEQPGHGLEEAKT